MIQNKYIFPFGEQLKKVEQKNKGNNRAFVLGVYASAVHAHWKNINGISNVEALAIASEPEIFWSGENAEQIISSIVIPKELGTLNLPDSIYNGPSGKALNSLYLKPLKLDRNNSWLCDLLPYSRVNKNQRDAINKYYNPICSAYNLPIANIPDFDKAELNSIARGEEIIKELEMSRARIIITLGDAPIQNFINLFSNKKFISLSSLGGTNYTYGRLIKIIINRNTYQLLPLCHPKQSGKLGNYNIKWSQLHDYWVNNTVKNITLN